MAELHGKQVVVVGGTSGFGLRVAELALAEGASVVIGGRNAERLDEALAQLGLQAAAHPEATGEVRGSVVDATSEASLKSFFAEAGQVDHLVSTVGGAMGGGFATSSLAQIQATVEHKVFDTLRVAQAAIPHLRAGSSVVFTAGTGGRPHTASGAILGNDGIKTLAEGLASELAPKTRVNVVAPTWTVTPFWRDTPAEQVEATKRYFEGAIPLGRTATIGEVAQVYLFLMKHDFITGQQIAVDGGVTLRG
ncbi:SDR family NAD(P)-dependent oxidoreductase [Silvibacterium sp.]|uniref:SDR family NAD(P)-dependent oxidoreductase n=1 Tax=Silvibacterium sp. TaxID=1964179 RepID=UPI0039E3B003